MGLMSLLDVRGIRDVLIAFAFVAVCMLLERAGPAVRNTTWRGTATNLAWSAASLLVLAWVPFPSHAVFGLFGADQGTYEGLLRIDFLETWSGQVALTATALLAANFVQYWYHRAQHTFGVLWYFHKVHHAAEEYNASITSRLHPLEPLATAWSLGVVLTLLFDFRGGDFHLAQRIPLVITAWSYFLHMNVKLDMGPLTWIAAGPAWHRYHHSSRPEHAGVNFAAHFPVVDLIFGTACRPTPGDYPPTGRTRTEPTPDDYPPTGRTRMGPAARRPRP